jgi:hypothetical protein
MSYENIRLYFVNSFFSEDRIRNGSKKLTKARATTQQGRLDTFFSVSRTVTTTKSTAKKTVRELFLIYRKSFNYCFDLFLGKSNSCNQRSQT